jgi:hypothetical protein
VLDRPQCRLSLRLVGDPLDHDRVSDALGITPTSTLTKGRRIGHSRVPARFSSWVLGYPAFHAWSVEDGAELFIGSFR